MPAGSTGGLRFVPDVSVEECSRLVRRNEDAAIRHPVTAAPVDTLGWLAALRELQ